MILQQHPSWIFAAAPSTDGSGMWIAYGINATGTGIMLLHPRSMILASNDHNVLDEVQNSKNQKSLSTSTRMLCAMCEVLGVRCQAAFASFL